MNKCLKVLFFNDSAEVQGGADEAAISSACALAHSGTEMAFFGASGSADPRLLSLRHRAPGLPQVHDPGSSWEKLRRGLWNPAVLERAEQFLEAEVVAGSTVVHVHSFTKVLSPALFSLLRKHRLPVILTLHDHFAFCPNGNYFRFSAGAPCDCRPLSGTCWATNCDSRGWAEKSVRMTRALLMKATRTGAVACDAFIAVSRAGGKLAASFLAEDRIHVVRNLLPQSISGGTGDSGAKRGLVYIGRLTISKGVAVLAEAAMRADVPITFVGGGEAAEEIQRKNPNAVITGWLPRAEVQRRIREARAVVLPSLWPETFGLSIPESLSMGVPVIVSDRAGAAELVEDGRNGLIWRTPSVSALTDCLSATMDNAWLREAEQQVPGLYERDWRSPQRHAEELLAVYRAAAEPEGESASMPENPYSAAGHGGQV
jgi:glycosyltransferase involved in cell wall biosynthesis